MTKTEMEQKIADLEEENSKLKHYIADNIDDFDDVDGDFRDECRLNQMVAERLAEEDRKNDERAENDELFACELRQIRYLESRYDDECCGW